MTFTLTQQLTEEGYRLTTTRTNILTFIEKHTGIFCAHDIISSSSPIDKVTVYRTLDLLEKLQLITPLIRLDGQQFYERNEDSKKGHHHHVICRTCKKTKCVTCKITLPTISDFSHIIHSSVFTGICKSCL